MNELARILISDIGTCDGALRYALRIACMGGVNAHQYAHAAREIEASIAPDLGGYFSDEFTPMQGGRNV